MRDSRGEVKIYTILRNHNVNFQEEYSFIDLTSVHNNLLRFDFAVFDDQGELDFLIEFQGKQHYVPVSKFGGKKGLKRQKQNDVLKRKYCLKNNIRLVTIPYYDEGKITYEYIMKAAGY